MAGLGIGTPIVQVYHEKSFILPDVSRVLACLYEKDVKFETHTASYKSLLRLQASSHAPVPFYDGPTFLEESREICRYIAEKYKHQGYPFLLGKDALERASVEQWLHNEEHAFNPPSRALFCHLAFPLGEEEDDDIEIHTRKLEEVLEVYEQRLSDSEFLVGNKFTLADLVHLPNSHYIKASNKFLYLYDSRKNVRRWWDAISDRDCWKNVLRYMNKVEEQNKQELKKKQQEEVPRTSADSIRLDSRKQIRTEPRTILVPPTDTMSSSSRVPRTKKPLPSDTSPDEILISSSHSTPASDKTSAVQSTKHATSPITAKKPPITDAAKSSTKDASILESSSSKDVSSNLDVFDQYPSHTDVDTPYIEPTTRKTSETLDVPPELEPTDTSASKLHTTDVHRRLQVEQWHSAKTGLNDLKHDADHLVSTQQGKPRKDVQQYPSQDSEQATSHSVPQEPMSRDVLSQLEDYSSSDQRGALLPPSTQEHGVTPSKQATAKDAGRRISSQAAYPGGQYISKQPRDHGSVPRQGEPQDAPSRKQETIDDTFKETRYHSVAPPSQTRYQTPPSKARYPTAEDASKQPKGTAPTPEKKAAQDDNDTSEESKTVVASTERPTEQPLDAWRSPVSPRRQKVEDSSRSDTSFQKRYDEDIQVANTASVSWQTAPDGDKNIFEETKLPDSTPTSAKPVYTPRAPFPPPRQAEVKDTKDKGRQIRATIPESQKMVSRDAQATHGERKTGTPGEQSSDRLQAIPQSRPPAAKGLSTKEEITNEQTVVPPLLSNESTSRVQPASESLQVASRGGLSTKPSSIEQWQRATVPLNDITSSSGDGEIGAETPGVQSASPSFPGASTAHHATSDDKFARQSIIDERVGEPIKMLPTPYSAPAHTKRETPDGHEIVHSELVSTPDGHISEASKIRQDQATVHEDVRDSNLSAHDVAKDTFKEAKVAESIPSSAKPMYSQQLAPIPRHAEMEDTWDKGMKGREAVPDRQQMLEKWEGTAREQISDRWKASAPSRRPAAEDVRGATGDTIQSPDVLDTSKKSRGAYEEAKGPGSVKEEKTSSTYQKEPLVAQDSQEQAQTIPAGEKADGSIRKHQQASDAPNTFVEKLNASEPARVKTRGDFSAEQPYRKDTTDDQKVAPPLSTRELTSHVQPPSEPSYDAGDLSSKPSTIYQWQRSSVPLHDVTSSYGDDEVAKSTIDEKPTPVSQQKSNEQRVEPPVPIEAEISGVQHASPSFPGASVDDRATIGDKFAKRSIIDERVGVPIQMQTSSKDARPSSEPTKRETPEGHEIGDLELVSTPGGQISEAKKARHDPAIVHEDVYDVILSTQDVGKDAFKETKVADSIPSSAQPQQPALTPSRQTQVEEARDKSMQSRETVPEQQKMVETKSGISGEQLSDRQKEIRPSRQPSAEDATIQSPDILDTPKKSRPTFEESIGPGSTLPKAQVLDTQDSQITKGESTVPPTDQRKDWKYAKDDESIMTEENSLSTKRLREMFQESVSSAPKTQLTDSEGSNALEKTSSVYHKGPLDAQDTEEARVIPADEKVDGSTSSKHHESFGDPYTDDEKLSVSAPARADIHDDHSSEEQYKKYTADDQKVAPSLSSKEPASQVQPASEPLQRAVPDGDLPSKSFTIDQWQRTAAPLHGVITDSGDDGEAMSSNNDQMSRSKSQEATPSSQSQSVNQMAKQSGEQRVEPPVPIVAEASDVGRAAPSLTEVARADVATISDKFTEQSNIDERVGKPKQMQAPITAAHPDSAPTLRRTPDSHEAGELVSTPQDQRLEGAKATRDPATIQADAYDANLSTHDADIDEKTATDHASGDEVFTGALHDEQALRPASIQGQPTVETPHDSDSFKYVHTGDSGKAELAKPTITDQEATVAAAGPTSADPQHADIVPAGVAHSEQKSTPSDKGSAPAAQHPSPVEPIKADSNVSAANYTDAPQMIFRQQARPPAPSTIGIRASDTQGVIGEIQEVTPDNRGTDDSGKPFVPNQEHVSHASEATPGQEEMTSPQGARVFPTSDTKLSSADVHEVTPDDQQTVESITPLVSSGKQGSYARSPFKPGEVGPAEKKFALSDEESSRSSEESISGEPRKEQTVIPTAKQTTAQPTIIGRQDVPDRKQALKSEDTLNNTATHDDVHRTGTIEPARRPLSVEGEKLMSATQTPSPSVARDSFHTELENVQSVKPSATPDSRHITPSSAPGEAALAEKKSASSGQGSADPAQPAFSLGPRNEEIRDSSPSNLLISSTDPSRGDPMVAVRDQAKDLQTTPGQQDILSTEHPSGKVQENIPGDNLGKAKPSRPSSAIQEGKPSKASASGIQLGSVPDELSIGEQKFAPPGQDSAYLARPPSSAEPRSKEIGDLAPSTQLNSNTDPRNKDAIVAAPDQTTDSQTTPEKRATFSAPSSQGPLGKLQEDEPANDSGEKKSSKPPSVVREGKPAAAVPISAPNTQHGAARDRVAVEQKFAPSGQDSVHSVQTSFSTEPTKEDTVVAPTDQTSTLERTVDQNYMTPAVDKAKTPFSGTPDASRKTQKNIEDERIDEKLPSQGQVSPDRHVSESPQGRSPEAHSDVVDKETILGSSEAETSKTGPGSTSIDADGRLSSSDMPAAGSLPETQDLQDSASSQNVLTDSLGKIKSPGHLSTDQAMAPIMSPSLPSVAPLGTVPGINSVQPPRQASTTSTVDLESVPNTQNGIPQSKSTPGEQKSAISDQELAHTKERPSSTEPRKEEANSAAGDQPNITQGPETTVRHQAKAPPPYSREALQKYQQPSHAVLPSDILDGPIPGARSAVVDKETTQTSVNEPNSTSTHGDVLPTRSVHQEAQLPPATQAPISQGLQDSGNIESPTQASTDQTMTPALNSAAPYNAPERTEPGPNSSRSVQTSFSTEPTKEDTIVTAADQAEDMQTITHEQAITTAPESAKPPFPGAQDASRKIEESIPDDGPVETYSPKPAALTQSPAETLDVSLYASSKAKSTGQGAKRPTGYQASSPETQLGSSQTQGKAASAEQKFTASDEKSADASKSFASAEPREEDTDAATADQTSVPPTNVTRQVTSSTPDASGALSSDQESSPDNGQIRNLGSPLTASQEEASHAGRASEGSTPKVHSAIVDEKKTLPSSQAQTSSTGPNSAQIGDDARLSGAGRPATRSMEKQEAEPPAATQAPTSKGLQDSGNIESPTQASTDQTMTPALNSAAPSNAPERTEPGPNSSQSVQTPFSTEPTKEDTIVTAADQAEDMQTVTDQQAITAAPETAKPPFTGAQDASRKFQGSIPDDGPVKTYSPKPAALTQPPAETLDQSPYASSNAKSTGQGAKPPTGYQASSPEIQLGSSQTQGKAAPAEQKIAASDEKSADASKSFASAEQREEDTDASTADQTSVPPTNVTRQVTSSTPDASDALSRGQESSPDNGQIRNLGSPLTASQEEASRAGRASEGSTPKVHSAIVDEKKTLPSSQAQTSSTGPNSAQIGDDAHLSGAGRPATRSMEKQEAEPPAATEAPTSKGLQDSENIESPTQASTDQTVTPALNSAAPSNAPERTEPGPNSSQSVQTPFSTEPTKEDTIATAADQAEDMQTVTDQQAITAAPETAKPPFTGAQDASRKSQGSIPDDGPVETYSPKPAALTQPPAETLDQSPYASSNAKSSGQGAKPPTGYQASSPETQLGSSQTQGKAAPAEQKFALSDEKSADASKSFASAEPREEDTNAATADQTSVPPTNVTRQVTSSTPDSSDALSKDQVSSPDNGQIRNLGSPLTASQEEASRAGRASEGSTPKVHSTIVDEKKTLPSSQAQTSSTGPNSAQIGDDAHLSGAGRPATRSMEKQEAEPPAATQAPTSKGLQDSENIELPTQASTDQTVTSAMNSAASSNARDGTEPGPNSSRSLQTPLSTEPTKEDTIVTASDQAEDMQTITHQQVTTPALDTGKPSFPGAQVASRKFQESTPDDGHIDEPPRGSSSEPHEGQTFDPYRTNVDEKTTAFPSSQANISDPGSDLAQTLGDVVPSIGEGPAENYSPKPGAQTQLLAATQDVSFDDSSKAKSTGQAAKAPTGYLASSPDTQLGSSQTQGEAAPAGEKLPVSGMHSVEPSKGGSFDVLSNEKTTTTQNQVNTLPNGDLSSNQVVEQSESSAYKGVYSGRNLEGPSTNEESKSQQQVDQFGTQSIKDNNKEADGTVRPNISRAPEELQQPPSRPMGESNEEPENQQLADQAIVKPLEGNEKQAEQTKPHETETAELEGVEDFENTNLKNNRISQVETVDQSGKEASVFQQLGKNTKDAPNSAEDAPGDGKAVSKSEHSPRSSEESKVRLQSENNTQGRGADAPGLETGHPSNGGLPANSYQKNSSQSQAEASNKFTEQSSPGIRNKDNDSSRLDDSTDPTKPET